MSTWKAGKKKVEVYFPPEVYRSLRTDSMELYGTSADKPGCAKFLKKIYSEHRTNQTKWPADLRQKIVSLANDHYSGSVAMLLNDALDKLTVPLKKNYESLQK